MWLVLIILAMWLWQTLSPLSPDPDLRIAAAANFGPVARRLATAFEAETGLTAQVILGSTGKHYAQIRQGAPFDVFLAADSLRPWLLDADGQAVAGSRWTYAIGRLAAWSGVAGVSPEKILTSGRGRVALANPRLAPYGVAADSVLIGLGAGQERILGENVAQAFQLGSAGGADVALVAFSQVKDRIGGSLWLVPDSLYSPIVQQGVLLVNSEAAQRFRLFLDGALATRMILAAGYGVGASLREVSPDD
jgi:molybdate transport system substrate-binding protein